MGKSSLKVNIKGKAIVAKKTVRDYILVNQIVLPSFKIPSKLMIVCETVQLPSEIRRNCKRLSKSFRKGKERVFRETAERIGRIIEKNC